MAFTPTYGSVFVYGAASAPDRVRLSGPSTGTPAPPAAWYGDSPVADANGEDYWGEDYGLPVDQWNSPTYPGYPAGPVTSSWVPNKSWLYGVDLPNGTYTRVAKPQWARLIEL